MDARDTVSVVVADDLTLFREGIVSLCESWKPAGAGTVRGRFAGVRVDSGIEARRGGSDLCLPKLDTLEVVRRARQLDLPSRLLVLTTREDRKTVLDVLRSGAHGILLKSGPALHLRDAVLSSDERRCFCFTGPGAAAAVRHAARPTASRDPLDALSVREHQVLRLLVEGFRAKEIAGRLELSAKTVDTYRASLMRKLAFTIWPAWSSLRFSVT